MKNSILLISAAIMVVLYSCNEQGGHGGNDAMYDNMNQNGASGDANGNDAASPSPTRDTINLSDDTATVHSIDSIH